MIVILIVCVSHDYFPYFPLSLSVTVTVFLSDHDIIISKYQNISTFPIDVILDYDSCSSKYGYSPLHMACEAGSLDIVSLLLDRGVDVNAKSWVSLIFDVDDSTFFFSFFTFLVCCDFSLFISIL